jgi:hypothetical protein
MVSSEELVLILCGSFGFHCGCEESVITSTFTPAQLQRMAGEGCIS